MVVLNHIGICTAVQNEVVLVTRIETAAVGLASESEAAGLHSRHTVVDNIAQRALPAGKNCR